MISYAEAKALIRQFALPLEPVRQLLESINGLVLAEAVVAHFDMPSFDNSAKDGYGIRLSDIKNATSNQPVSLALQNTIQAGDFSTEPLAPGSAVKIMTGAAVPLGVEAIVMREFCKEENGVIQIFCRCEPGEHIRKQGEEFSKGSVILPANTVASPPVIGLLATLGYDTFSVYPSPKVAILLTGDELVPPGQVLHPGQIYDANSYALRAALQQLGIPHCSIYHAQDRYEDVLMQFREALAGHDVVLAVGGMSVGDFDFVKAVVENSNVQTVFWRVAIKPGMPFYFGKTERYPASKLVFGLPGNPVSALLTFHQLVQPALAVMMGKNFPAPKAIKARLTRGLEKEIGRLTWVRGARFKQHDLLHVEPLPGQESHMLGGLAAADCLIHFPASSESLEQYDNVLVEPLSWTSK